MDMLAVSFTLEFVSPTPNLLPSQVQVSTGAKKNRQTIPKSTEIKVSYVQLQVQVNGLSRSRRCTYYANVTAIQIVVLEQE